jgi:uncharacterized BrkB/YihY/UPF0761 family membrane protein
MKQAKSLITKAAFGLGAAAVLAGSVFAAASDTYTYDYSGADSAAAGGIMAFGVGVWILVCCVLLISIVFLVFNIMMIMDVMKRTEAEMPNKQTWMILLIVGLLFGFGPIVTLIYYFGPKKKLGPVKK